MAKAGDIITALFREKFGSESVEGLRLGAGLFSSWTQVVSEVWPSRSEEPALDDIPAAALHSRVRELERGVLLVEADHPGWIQVLQMKQKELLASVRRRYPKLDIHGIGFTLSRGPFAAEDPKPEKDAEDDTLPEADENAREPRPEKSGFENTPPDPASGNAPPSLGRGELYTALKGLEKSFAKRNKRTSL